MIPARRCLLQTPVAAPPWHPAEPDSGWDLAHGNLRLLAATELTDENGRLTHVRVASLGRSSPRSAAATARNLTLEHGWTERKNYADLHISPQLLNDILASRRLLTPVHCLKLGRYFGNEPEYWMRLQNHYLFRKIRREKAAELRAVVPLKIAS